jgi:hypothetical protein
MGYTHYINHYHPFSSEQWADVQRFITAAIAATDVPICSGSGAGPPEITDECIHFNGCGDDSYEDFYLDREATSPHAFCKTERKPYDVVVVALLIYINETTDCLDSGSDGGIFNTEGPDQWDEFTSARGLIAKVQELAA